ncbi:MAG: hypothetical protein KR126chlam3_00589 [Chlamydiae bacterium]|nr:hypothetical protein [Chlamydiota bacterium]
MSYPNEICVERYPDNLYLCSRQEAVAEQIVQLCRLWTIISSNAASTEVISQSIANIEENLRITLEKLNTMRSINPNRLQRDILEGELFDRTRMYDDRETQLTERMTILEEGVPELRKVLYHTQLRQKCHCYALLLVVAAIAVCFFRI